MACSCQCVSLDAEKGDLIEGAFEIRELDRNGVVTDTVGKSNNAVVEVHPLCLPTECGERAMHCLHANHVNPAGAVVSGYRTTFLSHSHHPRLLLQWLIWDVFLLAPCYAAEQ